MKYRADYYRLVITSERAGLFMWAIYGCNAGRPIPGLEIHGGIAFATESEAQKDAALWWKANLSDARLV